ncbi:peptidoglycan D,D-transpeptidase FtsI family protein [Thermovibrio sp.]
MRALFLIKRLIERIYSFIKPFKDDKLNYFILASLLLVFVFSIRLLQLSYFDRDKWLKAAERQSVGVLKLSYKRGDILDRNGDLLAASLRVFSLYIRPTEIKDRKLFKEIIERKKEIIERFAKEKGINEEQIIESLAPFSKITSQDIEKAYKKKFTIVKTKSGKEIKVPFVWLKKDVSIELPKLRKSIDLALKIYYDLSGENKFKKKHPDLIGFVPEYKRVYPYGVGSVVVGYTNKFGEGLSGLEYILEKKGIITGKTIKITGNKDAKGRIYLGNQALLFLIKEKGNNVKTTIDGNLQYIVEKTIEKYGKKWHPNFINAVLMNPNTGEVLAAASWPFFKYGKKLTERNQKFLTPRFITFAYEPGSVMKPFVLASALNEGLITINSVFHCPPTMKVGDKVFKNEFHGKDVKLRAWEIIEYSDNVGIIQVAQLLGKERLYRYYKAFGFGSKTHIELPGESPGILRNWKKWRDVDFATLSFGHNISTTTLQLAAAYSALVNGGIYYKPTLIKEILDDKGKVIKRFEPVKVRRVISEKVSKEMRRVLTMVVEGGTGTATKFVNFYVGGKTGTAQKWDRKLRKYNRNKITATFAGAFPSTNPRFVLVITVDEPKVPKNMLWASKIAVPIFREIAQRVLLYERTSPDRRKYFFEPGGKISYTEINQNFILTNGLQQKKK